MVNVIKQDGSTEVFDAKKTRRSIEKAVVDAGFNLEDKKSKVGRIVRLVVDSATKKGKINTKEIRKMILNDFDNTEPSISRSWREFDKKYKSKET